MQTSYFLTVTKLWGKVGERAVHVGNYIFFFLYICQLLQQVTVLQHDWKQQ